MTNKILKFMALAAVVVASSSCLKDKGFEDQEYGNNPDGSPGERSVKILEGGISGGDIRRGLLVFADPSAALDSSSFTVAYVDYKSPTAPSTISVTLAKDPGFIATYNASQGVQYELMPDSLFSIPTLSTTIAAGQTYSPALKIYFKPNKFNTSKIYMLPIKITSASGVDGLQVQANYGYIAYSKIGNPLAGDYQDYGQRFNFVGAVVWAGPAAGLTLATAPGTPSVNPPAGNTGITTYNFVTNFSAVDGQTVAGVMGNVPDPAGGSALYFVTGATNFTNITFDFSSTFNAGYSNIKTYVRGYIAPSPTVKPAFRLITHYNNAVSAGSDRIIDETFLHL